MSTQEFIKDHIKSSISTAKSNFVLFDCYQNEADEDKLENTFKNLAKLLRNIHNYLIDNKIHPSNENMRVYSRDKEKVDTCYSHFSPAFIVGYSPFSFYSEDGVDKGVMVNVIQHNFTYCQKTLKKLANEYQQKQYRADTPVSKTMATAKIKELVATGDIELPINENVSKSAFYLDFENHRILAKSSHRDQDAIHNVFSIVPKIVEFMIANGAKESVISKLLEESLSERIITSPLTNRKMNQMKSSGIYCLTRMVDYYSSLELLGAGKKIPVPIEPTWSCVFSSVEDNDINVSFKESLSLFISNQSGSTAKELADFSILKDFSLENDLKLNSLTLVGEIPSNNMLKELANGYAEEGEVEENIPTTLTSEYSELKFNTYSKDGNICLSIKGGLNVHQEAMSYLIRSEISDTSFSQANLEKMILERTGSLYQVLHESANLFVKVYLESNKIDKNFKDKEMDVDQAINEATNAA